MSPRKPIILCVDDEAANLKLLENMLVPRGHEVVSASSGKDALAKIKTQAIDLVLLDIMMPGMDGFEVCRRIKEDQKLRNIPIIMITVLTAKQDRIRGIEAGAEEFLSKPFDQTEVLSRIKILLKLKKLDDGRKLAEELLQKAHDELDRQVQERTTELVQANEMLQADITERMRIETALRKSEKKFHDIFENVLDAYYETDIDGTILEISPSIEIVTKGQYHRDELIGKSMKDFYSDSKMRQILLHALQERGNVIDYEIELKNRDGSTIPCSISSKIHFDAQGRPEKILGTIRDITERKQAEEALNAISTHQEALLSSVPDLIMETDTNKVYTWANPEGLEFFGKDVIGKEASFYFYSEQNTYEVVKPLFRGDERVIYVESWQRRRDGEKRLLAWWSRVLKDGSGNVIGVVSSARDITERKQAEGKIINSLAEKEVLLKEVHHRVKNNLMTIIGLIKMQETKANNELFNPLLQELESRLRSMALVHEILIDSKDLARIDLQNYIETMHIHIHAQFGAGRNIRFMVKAAGVEAGLDIAVPCGLILNEMIVNAYKHAFPAGKPRSGKGKCEITVSVKHEGDILTMTVADNGVGQPFDVDIENPQTLGLKLIKMLSQQIGGSLEMERSSGTVYHLKFPKTIP